MKSWSNTTVGRFRNKEASAADGHHSGENAHGKTAVEPSSIRLSAQAQKNIGLTGDNLREIELETFIRKISIPAKVVERPGRSTVKVVAPMTGIVTAVDVIESEAVSPSKVLFTIRLIHEDLVQAQTAFLKTLGELDVEKREIVRLEKITGSGIIAGKVLLERKYAQEKLQAVLNANRQALLLHGFSVEQVSSIETTRQLLSEQHVSFPLRNNTGKDDAKQAIFLVKKLWVSRGAFVNAGDPLCDLVDYGTLHIQGAAFEHDAYELSTAWANQWPVTAVGEETGKNKEQISNLKLIYLDNQVDAESRALHFYVNLPNRVLHEVKSPEGHHFVTWRFKPGQRMQLQVPVEEWTKRFVVPVDAVAQEGAEYFVFQQNGDLFERREVHVEYRDQFSVVIANDGSLFPGDVIAFTGAHQLQMAIKNEAGGGVDPHAGHTH